MAKFTQGIYQICNDAQPLILAILILMLVVAGIGMIVGGEEARGWIKERIKYILMGAAIGFGATELGKLIASWFM